MLSTPHRRAPPGFSDVIFQRDNPVIQPPNREIQLRFHHSKKNIEFFFFFFPPTWTMIYTYRLPLWETCREISLQKALSPFVSFDRNHGGAARAARKKRISANDVKCEFFAGSLKPFLVLDFLFRSFLTPNPDHSERHFPEFQPDS